MVAAAVVTTEPSPSMRPAVSISLPILLAIILLPVIAFAIPVDPSWIAGIYDDADGDDIVNLVYETSAANPAPPPHLGPLLCLLEMSLENIGRNVPARYVTRGPRSPPVACSLKFTHHYNSLPPPLSGGCFRWSFADHNISRSPSDDLPCPALLKGWFNLRRASHPTDGRG